MLRQCTALIFRGQLRCLRPFNRPLHYTLLCSQEPRVNPVGIQYLSKDLHKKVFPKSLGDNSVNDQNPNPELLSLAKDHLKKASLLGKKTMLTDPISIPNFPELVGKNTLDEHFSRIGYRISKPYLDLAHSLLDKDQSLPPIPKQWELQLGWTRYAPGEEPQKVDFPLEDALVFDVEVLYKVSQYPVLATAASPQAWYAWVSPVLTNHTKDADLIDDFEHLIPMATHSKPKLLVGYNVSYDRARILEEYNIKQSKAFFLDAMALHISISGFCSQQRPLWHAHRKHKSAVKGASDTLDLDPDSDFDKEMDLDPDSPTFSLQDIAKEVMDDPWLNKGSTNSLASAAEFHCGILMLKDPREFFSSTRIDDILENFQLLMNYCAQDVDVTFKVSQKLFPEFRTKNPHPVSFAALKLLGTLFCPTTTKWQDYIESAESVYQKNREKVTTILKQRARELVEYIETGEVSKRPNVDGDPWLMHLNWNLKEARFRKNGQPYAKLAFLTGYPEWYRELFKSVKDETGEIQREMNLSVRTRVTPYLLKLKWEGYPLVWTNAAGWCFKVPANDDKEIENLINKKYTQVTLDPEKFEDVYSLLREGDRAYELFRVPHPEGPKRRCTSIMTKSYLKYFDSGELSSEYEYAAEILNLNATASYWIGNRARIMDQFVVYADYESKKNKFFDTKAETKANKGMGMIIPKFCTMGTVTRRATENTWLTASNSKSNRIGSELKAMITPPPKYVFVGADVDSEELWIASLIGDSMFQLHGATALGWMTLEGDKNEKTDLHSRTADIMGILRNDAKIFNYGRIYGAGVKFATQLLQKCSNNLSDTEAEKKAQELYKQTKGLSSYSRALENRTYHGGTESVMFNALEAIAQLEDPKTPVLGASITDALTRKYLNKNNYLTSRVNWAIQSSGVDYLHLLIVSMEHLIEQYAIDARLMITVHDELRYMVREDQSLKCALLLQISNLWTRAMFCEQLGIHDVPQSCAFFSEVDIDHVLRKEVGMNCVTPSHPEEIPPGKSYNIRKLLDSFDVAAFLKSNHKSLAHLRGYDYKPRVPVMKAFDVGVDERVKIAKLGLQNCVDKAEWTKKMTVYLQEVKKLRLPLSVNLTGSPGKDVRKFKESGDKLTGDEKEASVKSVKTQRTSDQAKKVTGKEKSSKKSENESKASLSGKKGTASTMRKVKELVKNEVKPKPTRSNLEDDEITTKDGDELLLAELELAGMRPRKLKAQKFASGFDTMKSKTRQETLYRSYSDSKYYCTSSGNLVSGKYMGPLLVNFSPKRTIIKEKQINKGQSSDISQTQTKGETSRASLKGAFQTSSTYLVPRYGTRKTSILKPTASKPNSTTREQLLASTVSNLGSVTDDSSADRNFRRRRDGAVYESEYRFGRGYRR